MNTKNQNQIITNHCRIESMDFVEECLHVWRFTPCFPCLFSFFYGQWYCYIAIHLKIPLDPLQHEMVTDLGHYSTRRFFGCVCH